MLEIKDLSYEYKGGFKALSDVTIKIGDNESVGLIGANGAGKSTLFKALTGLIDFEGEITVDGLISDKKNIAQIRKKIGYVVQESEDQMFMPKVIDDVMFGLLNYGTSREEAVRISDEILERLGLSYLRDRYNHTLSGGEIKMAAIATILALKPDIVLFDEPTSSLDPHNRRMIINTLNSIKSTKIVASHDLDLVYDTCDRIILMNSGKVVKVGGRDEILKDEKLLTDNMLELPLRFQK